VRLDQPPEPVVVLNDLPVRMVLLGQVAEDPLHCVGIRIRTQLQELVEIDKRRLVHARLHPGRRRA